MIMSNRGHLGNRKSRTCCFRTPSLGYYLIITDTDETEKNYFNGLRDSLSKETKEKLVIKVIKALTKDLVKKAMELSAKESQFQQIWIVLDRDQVRDFDLIISSANSKGMSVGWSNPCFEIWLESYFGSMKNCKDSQKCCDIFSKIFEQKVGKKYEKNSKTIYKDVKEHGNEIEAIRLASTKFSAISKNEKLPSNMSPATTVYKLVEEIRGKD